ncbi:MAG: diphthine--ammonia ligase [Dehalococcoidia bacterium]|nr:MAG: diphthine--ammonia ligase [Dehalococcoidia bacterium]
MKSNSTPGLMVAVSWSGGKDSSFSLYRAMLGGLQACFLLNFINRDVRKSMSHGLDPKLLSAQAKAIGIPIIQREVTWDTYEQEFKRAVEELKQEGVGGVVSGDIDLQEHKDWIDRVCGELGVMPILPLWGAEPEEILSSFIDAGFEAMVVTAKAEFFGQEWLGKRVSREFIRELNRLSEEFNIHICGEKGEYHTFVTDGPLFKRRIKIIDSKGELREGYWLLDILRYEIVGK